MSRTRCSEGDQTEPPGGAGRPGLELQVCGQLLFQDDFFLNYLELSFN